MTEAGDRRIGGYVRVTFKPAGAARRRSFWARPGKPVTFAGKAAMLWRVLTREGVPTDEIVIGTRDETQKPASLSLKYGLLEVDKDHSRDEA